MREDAIEQHLRKSVKSIGGLCLKLEVAAMFGWPDRTILMRGGRVAFAELKRPKGGRKGPLQDYWRERLRGFGFKCEFLRTKAEVDEFVSTL